MFLYLRWVFAICDNSSDLSGIFQKASPGFDVCAEIRIVHLGEEVVGDRGGQYWGWSEGLTIVQPQSARALPTCLWALVTETEPRGLSCSSRWVVGSWEIRVGELHGGDPWHMGRFVETAQNGKMMGLLLDLAEWMM